MKCPYCGYEFRHLLLSDEAALAELVAPLLCESCARVGLLVHGTLRKVTEMELAAIKQSPAWHFIGPIQSKIRTMYAVNN